MQKALEKGQALVLVLLSLAVILTLVLFILSRTVTDVAVSSRQEESVRAFSAAEAGVERALVAGASLGMTQIGNAQYSANVSDVALAQDYFLYPIELFSGDSSTIWFLSHDTNGNPVCDATHKCFKGRFMNICWGKPGTSSSAATTPAIETTIFYETTPGDLATVQIARAAFDPSTRAASNSFSSPDLGTCTVGGENYQFQKLIDFSTLGIPATSYGNENGLLFARVRMFYNTDTSHPVAFDISQSVAIGGNPLPSQGINIDSTGTAGQSNRKIAVFQSWPEPPQPFDYVVYSSVGLTK